ncbi:hypothetical protein ACFPZ0_05250 [Streptomonospora nanhaiensis]|uniref:hypothetical protein n=1 Tax=Streptomonospora nanhaiensis TaxID=1323731 RepID=UPI001FE86B4A|nr:hypothetical protein [Streptomonospora nanhaiensis]
MFEAGSVAEAEQAASGAAALHQRTGNRMSGFSAMVTLAWTARARGDLDGALARLTTALELAYELGNEMRIAYASMELGRLHADRSDLDGALDAYHRSAAAHHTTGDTVREAEALQGAAEVRKRQHAVDEAAILYEKVLEIHRRSGAERRAAFAQAEYGRLLLQARRYAKARPALEDAQRRLSRFADVEAAARSAEVAGWLGEASRHD